LYVETCNADVLITNQKLGQSYLLPIVRLLYIAVLSCQLKVIARGLLDECNVARKTAVLRFCAPSGGGLRDNVQCSPYRLSGKRVVDLIELISLGVTAETLQANID